MASSQGRTGHHNVSSFDEIHQLVAAQGVGFTLEAEEAQLRSVCPLCNRLPVR